MLKNRFVICNPIFSSVGLFVEGAATVAALPTAQSPRNTPPAPPSLHLSSSLAVASFHHPSHHSHHPIPPKPPTPPITAPQHLALLFMALLLPRDAVAVVFRCRCPQLMRGAFFPRPLLLTFHAP